MADLARAFKADPAAIAWDAGARGGPAHLLVAYLAKTVGADPAKVHAGCLPAGGRSRHREASRPSRSAVKAGRVRALAVTSPAATAGIASLKEQGINLVFANWHGLLAGPGLKPSQRDELLLARSRRPLPRPRGRRSSRPRAGRPCGCTGSDYARFLDEESRSLGYLAEPLGLRPRRLIARDGRQRPPPLLPPRLGRPSRPQPLRHPRLRHGAPGGHARLHPVALSPARSPAGRARTRRSSSREDIATFAADPALREELRKSLDLMLAFYGLARTGSGEPPPSRAATSYAERSREWLDRSHNFLRISRILRCLALLGCKPEARAFLACLEEIVRENGWAVGSDTLGYWRRAAAS